uniref:Uncharacterized protein n=1 Tax=Panstrongylus lignarius TaxID=156445 RepID=A0A224Y3Z7_9HEMI
MLMKPKYPNRWPICVISFFLPIVNNHDLDDLNFYVDKILDLFWLDVAYLDSAALLLHVIRVLHIRIILNHVQVL